MKKAFTLLLVAASFSLLASTQTKANNICFTDGFGYTWKISYWPTGNGGYSGTGTVDIGSGTLWNVTGWGQFSDFSGNVELHAVNPSPDGCTLSTDSFVYVGTAQVYKNGGSNSWSGSGTWNSYCACTINSSGTWDASGPCGSSKQQNINPNGPAKHMAAALKSSNTICFTDGFGYKWTVTYVPHCGGLYTGTGTVNIGGGDIWNAVVSGQFESLTGQVSLAAINPAPDGCTSASDSFVYVGSAQVLKGSSTSWSGAGNWNSYCFGGVLNSGTWSATGPCNASGNLRVDPNGPATHGSIISLIISPNPANNHSSISFKLSKQSQVQVTVFNYLQQPVKVLVSGSQSAGKQTYNWDLKDMSGKTVSSGLYRVVAVIDGKAYTNSIQVIR